jgi:type III restriction enzyme
VTIDSGVRSVAARLSLREPQTMSLHRLANALAAVPALRDRQARNASDLAAMIAALQVQFPTLSDFERDFPSLCFALATGVGKTRLMGAFISYLHATYGYKHFFVLAPNLTIYDKLIRDFTPNTSKYVFKGVAEFAISAPEVITGETYAQHGDLVSRAHDAPVQINIFNISKINSEVRGGRAPRIKRLSEYLGESYFDYLAKLPDLVLLMDESHRYRASAGIRALNELKPIFGLELTATPFIESGKNTIPFKNVVMDYPLARAIEDGFVKEPAVVTQQNFDPSAHSAEQLERIKLMDGVRVHEETKVHLLTYAQQKSERLVKPFILVIARDTTHASQLLALIQSVQFFGGRYRGKVIQVDSSTTSGAEGDEVVQKLLAVESVDETTEIVIHVNMLKEGWDVTNLYTIVPLRAANARTLIEQSIGRGLRLPYGRKTGVEAVDRLNIIAHDKFQEVVDEAGRADSPIRLKQLRLDPISDTDDPVHSVAILPMLDVLLGIHAERAEFPPTTLGVADQQTEYEAGPSSAERKKLAQVTLDVIHELSRDQSMLPTSAALNQVNVQQQIIERVRARIEPTQVERVSIQSSVEGIVKQAIALTAQQTIDIPKIQVLPRGIVRSGYRPFVLDVSRMNFQPQDQQLVGRGLQSAKDVLYGRASTVAEARPENYIVRELLDFDELSYDEHADLIHALASAAVAHFRSYLKSDDELHNVLANHAKAIAENIRLQLAQHHFDGQDEFEVVVHQGFTPLKPGAAVSKGEILPLHEAPYERSKIATLVYGGFSRCAYNVQKFHVDSERVFAQILERDSLLWFRPLAGQFNIYYRSGVEQPEYVPDFVAATADFNLLVETKRATDMEDADVKAKAQAASIWCRRASEYAGRYSQKPWRYLLIPHDAISVNQTLTSLSNRYAVLSLS